jgi:nucleotide-binding universal stress UspA family protein
MPAAPESSGMFDRVVIATDGSGSVERAVDVALDLAGRFDAEVHALTVVDEGAVASLPETPGGAVREALSDQADEALASVTGRADREVTTAVREGRPAAEITAYARSVEADCVAMGSRGRGGEHSFRLSSVAEHVVRTCPVPVLTVRQPEAGG